MKEYIIIWRSRHRYPHIHTDMNDFVERFSTYEDAVDAAEDCVDNNDHFDYEIFETSL